MLKKIKEMVDFNLKPEEKDFCRNLIIIGNTSIFIHAQPKYTCLEVVKFDGTFTEQYPGSRRIRAYNR